LNSLRAAPMLRGARGVPPADLDRLTEVILAIGDLALALGDDLGALEVNPLHVHGSTVEALDGLLTWRTA
jgi:succinyl-CoA synthetase beta subunit